MYKVVVRIGVRERLVAETEFRLLTDRRATPTDGPEVRLRFIPTSGAARGTHGDRT